ncbi:hypothetical protein KDW46_02210 [Burkholderia vietnamiensis]|nr:hypothetical protein [Burkholderia vietnamiensis]
MKTRIQFDIPQDQMEGIEKMSRAAGIATRKELFNNALTLFEWAVSQIEEGRSVCSITDDAKSYRELVMPWMKHAKNFGGSKP